jgi:dolichol-phosphate mannosyltransferase
MSKTIKFSVVIPVYNEEGSLEHLQQRLYKVMESITTDYEILYIDDGSSDRSSVVLQKISQNYPAVKVLTLLRNSGQSTALFAGFKAAAGRWIITLDSDGQNPPEDILRLIEFCGEFDYIAGVRKKRNDTFGKRWASKTARAFRSAILGDITRDTGCSLKVFKKEIAQSLPLFRNFHRFFTFLVRERGFSVKEVSVSHEKRKAGKSKYGNWQRLKEGVWDLMGVVWLKTRMIKYEIKS